MKRVVLFVALQLFAVVSLSNAATFQVNFNGTIDGGGTLVGMFSYNDADLNTIGDNSNNIVGLPVFDLLFSVTDPLASDHILIGTDVGVTNLNFNLASELVEFKFAGFLNTLHALNVNRGPDFVFLANQGYYADGVNNRPRYFDITDFSVENISAVPLPAAAWMFIAGLAALMGGKWRLKRKMPTIA